MLALTHELLVAVLVGDHDAIARLRADADADWWNVSLTLAYLLEDVFAGKPEALEVIAQTLRDAQNARGDTVG